MDFMSSESDITFWCLYMQKLQYMLFQSDHLRSIKVSSFYFGSVWEFHNCNRVPFEI